jgi:hypothetical protein
MAFDTDSILRVRDAKEHAKHNQTQKTLEVDAFDFTE